MAFPTINAQQELNNRKILEDLQLKKHLLTKSGTTPTVTTIPGLTSASPLNMPLFLQSGNQQHPQHSTTDITLNNTSRAAWTQATSQSFGFFVHQDSVFGNSILPVLPRFDNGPPNNK